MDLAIGSLLPLALGIAISPVAILSVIQMLLSPNAKATSLSFLAGWLAGMVSALIVFTLLSSILPRSDPQGNRSIAGVIKILIGALVLFLAARQVRSNSEAAPKQRVPEWKSITPLRGLRLGFTRSALHPSNLLFTVAAGTVLGTLALPADQNVIAVVVFTVIGSSTVWVPIAAHLMAPQTTAGPLEQLRDWTLRNTAGVRPIVLLIMGVFLVGNGIANF